MTQTRSWQLRTAGVAAGIAAAACFSSAAASAEPVLPAPPPYPGPSAAVPPNAYGNPAGATAGASPAQTAPSPYAAYGQPVDPAQPTQPTQPTQPAQPAPPPLVPASSGTLRDYFAEKQVGLEPQHPQDFSALSINLPVPPGWTRIPDPNVVDAFAVIANRNVDPLYPPNAQIVVYKLDGDFEPHEAITHGFVENQKKLAWRTTNASLADFGGFPSSIIEGAYSDNGAAFNTSQRNVIATSGAERYLVSLTVTTTSARSVGQAPATDAIINGFRVGVPSPPAAPAQQPPAAPAPHSGAAGAPGPAASAPAAPHPGAAGSPGPVAAQPAPSPGSATAPPPAAPPQAAQPGQPGLPG